MLQARQKYWAVVGAFLGLSMLVMALGERTQAAPAPDSVRNKDSKDKPGADDAKKDRGQPGKGSGFPLPFDIEMMFKNLPPGTIDPAQMERMKKEMQKMREQYQKMMEEMSKKLPGGFPGGVFPGGAFPPGGFPAGGFPPNFPGGPGGFGPGMMMQQFAIEGRLGARIEKPSDVLIDQLDLPKNQGLVIREVKANSAAAKAGLKANDILLEINGKPVPHDAGDLVKKLRDIKADATVDAVVLRKGKKETIKGITLPEFKFPGIAPPPGAIPPGRNGQFPRLFNTAPPRLAMAVIGRARA